MPFSYILAPFVGWIAADLLKSVIDSIKNRKWRLELLSYGGFPSSHATVAVTTTTLIGFRDGHDTPAYSLALTVTVLFIVDALQLRRWVGQHARALNALLASQPDLKPLRERVGHTWFEILGGVALGWFCGYLLNGLAL